MGNSITFVPFLISMFFTAVVSFFFMYKDYKTVKSLRKQSEIREKELNQFKTKAGIDEYVKQEALSVLKFYKGRKWDGTGKELTETWDEFYEKYQKSKTSS